MEHCTEVYRNHCGELSCIPTEVSPKLSPQSGIRVVIFDLYGTLFISGSGDIGSTNQQEEAIRSLLLKQFQLEIPHNISLTKSLTDSIKKEHERKRSEGIPYPEIDIRDHWREVLSPYQSFSAIEIEIIATSYETITNPIWPMPDAENTLQEIAEKGFGLGIISNAQFYTPALFPALLPTASFNQELCVYSYQEHHAKPGLYLFEKMVSLLQTRGIKSHEVLYIGNDMQNDINPAKLVGFNTVLFAGDKRSYRPRKDCDYPPADCTITSLPQIIGLLL